MICCHLIPEALYPACCLLPNEKGRVLNFFVTGFGKAGLLFVVAMFVLFPRLQEVQADHFARGLPSFGLDANSRISKQKINTQTGDYFVSFVSVPAFFQPGQSGQLDIFVKNIGNLKPFKGKISLHAYKDWTFARKIQLLGTQTVTNGHFMVNHTFSKAGNYTLEAKFGTGSQLLRLEFPLRVGQPVHLGPLFLSIVIIFVSLLGVNLIQNFRIRKGQIL